MSAIGRIIIVLNLLLAAAFMGYAANLVGTADDFKGQIATLKSANAAALAEKDEAISSLEATVKTLSDEKRDFREARDANESKAGALASQLEAEKRRADGQATELTKITSALGDVNGTITRLTGEKDDAVEARHESDSAREAAAAKALAAELAMRDAADAAALANATIEDLRSELDSLKSLISAKDAQLTAFSKASGIGLNNVMAVPEVEGAVVSVASDLSPALVMLNVGSNQGVRAGTVFDIFTGSTYKGQCRVEQVDANVSSAVVVRTQAGRKIAPGDTASTKL